MGKSTKKLTSSSKTSNYFFQNATKLLDYVKFLSIAKSNDRSIVGKWEVVAINNGSYFDYKDSGSSIKQFLNSLRGKKDSTESLKLLLRTIGLYRNYYIVFNENGTYKEVQGSMTLGTTSEVMELSGSYEINLAHMYIELWTRNKIKHYYRISFTKTGIKLQYLAEGLLSRGQVSDMILTLEKPQ